MKNKILVLSAPVFFEFASFLKNVDAFPTYRPLKSSLSRKLFRLEEHIPYHGWNFSRFYGDWKEKIHEYETVVIISTIRGRDVIKFIQEKNPTARIMIYYVDTNDDDDRKHPKNYKDLNIEFASFDPQECKDFTAQGIPMRFEPYCYCFLKTSLQEIRREQKNFEITDDIFFVGMEKNRFEKLLAFKNFCLEHQIKVNMQIVQNPHTHVFGEHAKHVRKTLLSYDEIREMIYQSKCILDLMVDRQIGLSQRPFESIFFEKKLITNNRDIKNYDFYRKENIFILDEQPLEELPEFLKIPYQKISDELVEEYTPQNWINRLLQK